GRSWRHRRLIERPFPPPLLENASFLWGPGGTGLLGPVGDATPGEVVRRQLQLHLVAGEDPDEVHPHLSRDVREHLVAPVIQDHPEHGVGKRLDDRSLHLDGIVLRHRSDPLRPSKSRQTAPFDRQTFVNGKRAAIPTGARRSKLFYRPALDISSRCPSADRVSTSWPSSVTRMVCSQWALSRPSTVTAVHPSSSTSTASVPAFTMGSTARTMPGRNDSSVPGRP